MPASPMLSYFFISRIRFLRFKQAWQINRPLPIITRSPAFTNARSVNSPTLMGDVTKLPILRGAWPIIISLLGRHSMGRIAIPRNRNIYYTHTAFLEIIFNRRRALKNFEKLCGNRWRVFRHICSSNNSFFR